VAPKSTEKHPKSTFSTVVRTVKFVSLQVDIVSVSMGESLPAPKSLRRGHSARHEWEFRRTRLRSTHATRRAIVPVPFLESRSFA
jgi:hypothetical protein